MKILLFCENAYAIDILRPLQDEAAREGGNQVLWFVDARKIPAFPLAAEVQWTNSIQEAYDFRPEAVFVPGNIVPYYLSGVKVQVFHGYAAEKKDHWIIRRYFDTYFTQGPYFTSHFQALARKYGDFEVLETGWTRQDWIHAHRHDYDEERQRILRQNGKEQIVLYAPKFSPKLTSLPLIRQALIDLVNSRSVQLLIKLHPLTRREWVEEYRQLARDHEAITFVDDYSVTPYMLMADAMISDTSSTIYEFLLLDKPVVTLGAISKDIYWRNITSPDQLQEGLDEAMYGEEMKRLRQWVIDNYDPYKHGKSWRTPLMKKIHQWCDSRRLHRKVYSIQREYDIEATGLIADHDNKPFRGILPSEVYGTPVPMPFEDTTLMGVAQPDEYLSYCYGDYMQMPKQLPLQNFRVLDLKLPFKTYLEQGGHG